MIDFEINLIPSSGLGSDLVDFFAKGFGIDVNSGSVNFEKTTEYKFDGKKYLTTEHGYKTEDLIIYTKNDYIHECKFDFRFIGGDLISNTRQVIVEDLTRKLSDLFEEMLNDCDIRGHITSQTKFVDGYRYPCEPKNEADN